LTSSPNQRSSTIVFLSASIPDSERWEGEFDPFAVTDAVVATARVVFTRGGTILTAAHPTVAPLILQVADGLPGSSQGTMVVLYQSRLFEQVIHQATTEMMERDYVEIVWTPAAPGERPEPGKWNRSLATMRSAMVSDVAISAAVFVGGMEGVSDEYERVASLHPDARRFALGRPGGAAAALPNDSTLAADLADSDLYPWLMERVMDEVFR
jgi:SLOG cluster3 family